MSMKLPQHKGGLMMEKDPHRSNYHSVEQEEAICWSYDKDPASRWISPRDRARAIETDSFWILQWYPETPIGFHVLAGTDLEALLARACEISPEPALDEGLQP